MSSFSRALLTGALLVGAGLALGVACSGSEFSSSSGDGGGDGGDGAGASGGIGAVGGSGDPGGNAGAEGSGGEGGSAAGCSEPADCDDGKACTIDRCESDGTCRYDPRCPGARCCGGTCAECCGEVGECDDGVQCTDELCFAGTCARVPADSNCGEEEFCSPVDDCRPRPHCLEDVDCPDNDPCRTPHCVDGLCAFDDDCEAAGLKCCAEGCFECCNSGQCDDGVPCTKDECVDGACEAGPPCGMGLTCCVDPSGASDCRPCCSIEECDDQVACTLDVCAATGCENPIDPLACTGGQVCNPEEGCEVPVECDDNADCMAINPCARCEGVACRLNACPTGERCCGDAGCRRCCDNAHCNDNNACTADTCVGGSCQNAPIACPGGQACVPEFGGCVECQGTADCNDNNDCTDDICNPETNACLNVPICPALGQFCCGTVCGDCCTDADCVGGGSVVSPDQICTSYACSEDHMCNLVSTGEVCDPNYVCCPVGGCMNPEQCPF